MPVNLRSFVSKYTQLNDEEWKSIENKLIHRQYKKGDFFIREGAIANHIGYMVSGIARVYFYAVDKEITSYFNFEHRNPIVSSFQSFLTQSPATENIIFLEDAEIQLISYSDLNELYEQPNILKFGKQLAEYNYLLAVKRIHSLQTKTATERYLELLEIYPNLILKIPHHHIASYLKITPEALSRVRKSLLDNRD